MPGPCLEVTCMKLKPVTVEWMDAESEDEWTDHDEHLSDELPVIKTRGYLVRETKDLVIVCLNVDITNHRYSQKIKIPKAWCKKISRR